MKIQKTTTVILIIILMMGLINSMTSCRSISVQDAANGKAKCGKRLK
jgi:hypothetical protein